MKTKLLNVLLLFVIVVALAGCGGTASQTPTTEQNPDPTVAQEPNGNSAAVEETELKPEPGATLIVWDGGEDKALIESAGKVFAEKYGVSITFSEMSASESIGQMITDGPAGIGADVFMGVHDRTGSGVDAGVFLPNDWFEEETKANNNELAVLAVTTDDIMYGYPMSVETSAVFYNKDLISEVPADWNGVIEFAKTFNDPKANKFAYMWDIGSSYWNYGFFGGYGAYIFGNDGTDPTDIGLNSEQGVEAAKFYQSLNAILPLQTSDVNKDIRKSLFSDGKLAMNVSGPWDTVSFGKTVKNLGVSVYPNLPNGQPMKPFSGVKAYYVSAHTKYPNAAKLFANLITSEEWQIKNFELTGALPANKKASENSKVTNDPFASVFLAQFKNSVPMPSIAEYAQYPTPMGAAVASLWNEGKDPKEVMDNMVNQMKSNFNQVSN
ncbi:arabinogalactan oligomer/maltooligosaccharide transport system substrate-binding protein [Fontibacillus solani]|uniref:Arabinogalactan oligomer/maltooligosaccharide transport system substrate-binding protein n=1 Tax=Fontibacillus solani TaxID=1572857 RepID=A0A7W3SZ70_9BACL|nr:maltose ABC transporter substrate-binding protein [Fontibacillus solani]MBA9088844.1 arabinogalactan oligomer/maltooligosaccharide transport system substrate-binding protein [Fontibacillus solani]